MPQYNSISPVNIAKNKRKRTLEPMYKFIFVIVALALIFVSAKPFTPRITLTEQQRLEKQIDEQVQAYDKALSIQSALNGNKTTELFKAHDDLLKTAATARKARLELCKNFSLIRTGHRNVKAQSCTQYQ